ncbi:hypothetical protein BGP_1048 [Beggiatoa sp. PS]|nr:hypothetical protein BGP_1048 [Beggiatoa sp. PS]
MREVWKTLTQEDKQILKNCLEGELANHPTKHSKLRMRGLVTEKGELFGRILETWLKEDKLWIDKHF